MGQALPRELLKSLTRVKDFDELQFLEVHDLAPSVSIRYNVHKFQDSIKNGWTWSLHTNRVPWSENGFYLRERPVFTLDPLLHAGAYYVQEASSMFIEFIWKSLFNQKDDLRVLDLCAAPGGKTTLISCMPGVKMILANEIIKTRVGILYENIVKWGDPRILISNNDPSEIGKLHGFFDVMVVDAPCSGSGLFRKDKDAIDEWSVDAVKHCSERQKRILADAIPSLKENGVLIYSTCSYSPEENEDVMDWLISKFDMEPIRLVPTAEWGILEVESNHGGYGYRFLPYRLHGEGFFISCFRQKREWVADIFPEKKSNLISQKEKQLLYPWIQLPDDIECILTKEDQLFAIPSGMIREQQMLSSQLHLRKSGLLAGALIRNLFIPEHELSQSILIGWDIPQISLDKTTALEYLRKMTIQIPEMEKGWYLVTCDGYRLGWVKNLGNRINNYYPASWRILMS